MNRKILLLDVTLLVLVCILGWYLRAKWIESSDYEHNVLTTAVRPAPVASPPPLKKVAPIDARAYSIIVERPLFSADRNPNPIINPPPPPPPPPPMPPLPAAYGVMLWDGVPPTVLLSLSGQGGQKGYRPADKIGQFTVVSVNRNEVVFDWNGKQVSVRLDDLMQKGLMANNNDLPRQSQGMQEGNARQPRAPPPTPLVAAFPIQAPGQLAQGTSFTGNDTNPRPALGPGPEVPGQGIHICVTGDSSPPGTVVNGLQKKMNTTPLGMTCHWEPVK